MKVTLLTIGSRGDIQPFIALAQGLARAGHDVMLGGPPDFTELAARYQVPFTPIGASIQILLQDSAVKNAITGGGVLRFLRTRNTRRADLYAQLNREALALCRSADFIIYKNAVLAAFGIAQKWGIPCAEVRLQPYTPTTAFPAFFLKGRASYGRLINWLSGFVLQTVVWQILRNDVRAFWRDELQLPPLPGLWPDRMLARAGVRIFSPISQHVLPRPHDWPAHLYLTGYWFLGPPPGWTPPPEVVRFLAAGEPPVYIGFGSMPHQAPRATFDLITRALQRSGQRGIVYSGWGGLSGEVVSNRLLVIESVPHEWLFSHVKAVVHHGGAGTTATGLRAGVPNVVVPFFADQPFWGWRVAALGAGPAPLLRQRLTAERLAMAIEQAAHDPTMRARAREIGARLQAEDGIAQTIELLRVQ
ncbi:hypothetical protein A6A03_01590 [Chloroflexus islandicus]|uniref:Uncharacterized protein n=1 Tax=Chloroflexus islandicus TaxID=1707952 RepID=A0A178MD70_9CHLR|nr:glycosyltransferase [Chloroflexus islandicus]OAN45978.1 hypothetical protein A6A03_01590 [Chloroflexus islandicus]